MTGCVSALATATVSLISSWLRPVAYSGPSVFERTTGSCWQASHAGGVVGFKQTLRVYGLCLSDGVMVLGLASGAFR